MQTVLNTAPTIKPITIDELKLHLKIELDQTIEDELLETVLDAAIEHVQDITNRKMLTQTWDYYVDCWPHRNHIVIPFGNLQSVTSVSYLDTEGDETTLVVDDEYLVETNGEQRGRIVLPYGISWPSTVLYPSNPIKIRFVCGWTTMALVPARIKSAIKLLAADIYQNREVNPMTAAQTYQVNPAFDNLLVNMRLWSC